MQLEDALVPPGTSFVCHEEVLSKMVPISSLLLAQQLHVPVLRCSSLYAVLYVLPWAVGQAMCGSKASTESVPGGYRG